MAEDEKSQMSDYLNNGGHLLFMAGCTQDTLTNLAYLYSPYGIDSKNGFAAEP